MMQTGTPPAAMRPLVGHPAAPPPVWAQICPAGLQYPIRRPSASVTACNFLFRPPFVQPIYRPRPRFCMQAASLALCLQRGPIDDDRLRIGAPGGQGEHDPGEVPSLLQRFQCSHSVLAGRYTFGASRPSPNITVDEDNAAQHAQTVNPRTAMAFAKDGAKALSALLSARTARS